MSLDPQVLEILACPDTHHAPLAYDADGPDADLHRVRPGVRDPRRTAGAAARRGPPAGAARPGEAADDGIRSTATPGCAATVTSTRRCSTTATGCRRPTRRGMLRATRLGRRPGARVGGAGRRGQLHLAGRRGPAAGGGHRRRRHGRPHRRPAGDRGRAAVPGADRRAPQRRHPRLGRRGRRGDRGVGLRSQPGGAGRGRGGRPARAPAWSRSGRPTRSCRRWPSGPGRRSSRCRGGRRPGPACGALTVPVLLAARALGLVTDRRGRPGRDGGPARRRRRAVPADRRVVRQPGQGARAGPGQLDPGRLGLVAAGDRRRPPGRRHALGQRPLPGRGRRAGRGRPGPGRPARRRLRRAGRVRAGHLRRPRRRATPTRPGCGCCCCATAGSPTTTTRRASRRWWRSAGPTRCQSWPAGAVCGAARSGPRARRRWSGWPR